MLIELSSCVENKMDKIMYESLIKENEIRLNSRIGDAICRFVELVNLNREQKKQMVMTIKGYIPDSFGAVGTFIYLESCFIALYQDQPDSNKVVDNLEIILVRYFARDIGKGMFIQKLWFLQETIGISDNFYDGLLKYFTQSKDEILKPILKRLDNLVV